MKKLIALVLALALVLASCAVAFAADPEYKITITNDKDNVSINGKTYYAYKVFDVSYTGSAADAPHSYSIKSGDWAWDYVKGTKNDATGVYTNSEYGLTFTPSASDPTLYAIDSTMTGTQARKLADDLHEHLPATTDAAGHAEAAGETATIALTAPGYYIVYGTAKSNDPNASTDEVVAACALTTVDPTETVIPKVDVPTLDKKITGQHLLDDAGKAATAQVGTKVSYQLTSAVPDLNGYTDYTFTFHDQLTDGLDYVTNSFVLKINNVTVSLTGTFSGANNRSFTLNIPFNILNQYPKGAPIVLTYDATVNSTALTTDYEKNTAYLEYTHSPYDNTTNRTPDKETYVIDVNIDVLKIDGVDTTKKLKDAEFVLFQGTAQPNDADSLWYHWNSTSNKVEWVTRENADVFKTVEGTGKLEHQFQGLEATKTGASYGLLETKAPTGYNLLSAPVIVTLTASIDGTTITLASSNTATLDKTTIDLTSAPGAQPVDTAAIGNNAGTELPSTGGIGTTIFYILGGLLVVGAAVILVARRKASN